MDVKGLFLLSWSVLDQPCELDVVEVTCAVEFLLVEHLFDLFLGESFTHRGEQTLQLLSGDRLRAFGVEAFESVVDDVFGVGSVKFLT